jgi:hypothetical protein
MARKNTRKSRNRKNRKTMKGGANNTAAPAAPAPAPAPAPAAPAVAANNQTGGRKRKMSSGAAKWRDHMMKVYRDMKSRNPATKLGDAMRAAKKTYSS